MFERLLFSQKHDLAELKANAHFIAQNEGLVLSNTPYRFVQDVFQYNGAISAIDFHDDSQLPEKVRKSRIMKPETYMEAAGGLLVKGEKFLFWGHKLGWFDEEREKGAQLFFPDHQLIFVEPSSNIRSYPYSEKYRVKKHIDQFIGADLPTVTKSVLVPVDQTFSKWNDLPQRLSGDIVCEIPTELLTGQNPEWNYQLLNYVRSPHSGITYICPKLAEYFQLMNFAGLLDFSRIQILPESVPNNYMGSGLKCTINFC